MLLGTYQAKFVLGRRVAVPAVLRKELGDTFILAKWYEGCLVLIGKSSWDALLKRLTGGMEMIVEPIRETEHFIYASAYEVVPDEQGRIIIPERLSAYSGLGEEVYFLGVGDRVEIWNKEAWEEKEKLVAREAARYIEELAKKKNG
jgi:MraZ protein